MSASAVMRVGRVADLSGMTRAWTRYGPHDNVAGLGESAPSGSVRSCEDGCVPLSHAIGRFNRLATNRVTGLVAGRLPGFGIVTHRGRRSGRTYRTR